MEVTAKPKCKESTDDIGSSVDMDAIMQYDQHQGTMPNYLPHFDDYKGQDDFLFMYDTGENKANIGKRIQSGVIVLILLLLWFYTIGMFIKRSRFLRTTGQRQSSYKSVIPPTTGGGGAATTATSTLATNALTSSATATSSLKQSVGMNGGVPSGVGSNKKPASVKSKCRETCSLTAEIPFTSDHNLQLQFDDSNSSPTHFRSGRHSLKICLPSWKIEHSTEARPSPPIEDTSPDQGPLPAIFKACDSFTTQSMYSETIGNPEVSIEVESHLSRQQKLSSSLLSPANGTEFESLVISVDPDYCNSVQNSQSTITNTNSLYDYSA